MDGYEATRIIRKIDSPAKRTPIVTMTAHAIKGYREKCLKAGMDDYITKPLKKEILLSTVGKWIQEKPGSTAPDNRYQSKPKLRCASKEPEVIDIKKAITEFDNDAAFFMEVFDEFLIHVEKQLHIIRQAIDSNDSETIRKESHSIKGGAANLIAIPLSIAASNLEERCKSGTIDDNKHGFEGVSREFIRLKKFRYK